MKIEKCLRNWNFSAITPEILPDYSIFMNRNLHFSIIHLST